MSGKSALTAASEVSNLFPRTGVCAAFAYGSGVFSQRNHPSAKDNMLDMVLVTDSTQDWHRDNLKRHRSHYSALGYLGEQTVASVQRRFGAGIYYNTLVHMGGRLVKYGVIDREELLRDLQKWETLYLSGRLHKPVLFITGPRQDRELHGALQQNLQHALRTAFLLLPESFSTEELYTAVASLSYAGDFRMTIGEDRQKVKNIVLPNVSLFHELYSPWLAAEEGLHNHSDSDRFVQDFSAQRRLKLLERLPESLQQKMNRKGLDLKDLATSPELSAESVQSGIMAIVKQSSWTQSLKGILTAGIRKSVRYGGKKLVKMWRSMR